MRGVERRVSPFLHFHPSFLEAFVAFVVFGVWFVLFDCSWSFQNFLVKFLQVDFRQTKSWDDRRCPDFVWQLRKKKLNARLLLDYNIRSSWVSWKSMQAAVVGISWQVACLTLLLGSSWKVRSVGILAWFHRIVFPLSPTTLCICNVTLLLEKRRREPGCLTVSPFHSCLLVRSCVFCCLLPVTGLTRFGWHWVLTLVPNQMGSKIRRVTVLLSSITFEWAPLSLTQLQRSMGLFSSLLSQFVYNCFFCCGNGFMHPATNRRHRHGTSMEKKIPHNSEFFLTVKPAT